MAKYLRPINVPNFRPLFKLFFKTIFYFIFMAAGSIIAFFLPGPYIYVFGFAMSVITRWCWETLRKEESHA